MHSPLTIVIPIHNRAHTIVRTLHSIDAQTLRPASVILVDNNSTDNSRAVISEWADGKEYVTILSEPKAGACAARNCGLREVSTEWTMFFDSDDVMLPNHVRDFTHAIASHPAADVIGRDIITQFIDGSSKRLYFRGGDNAMFHHLFRGCLSTQRFVGRTSLFRAVGAWDESLCGWNDFELGVRLLLHTRNVVDMGGTPSVTTYQQSDSITGTNFSSHPERWEPSLRAIRTHFLSLPDSDKNKRRYLDWLDARAMILAAQYEQEANKKSCGESFSQSVDDSFFQRDGESFFQRDGESFSQRDGESFSQQANSLAAGLYNEVITRTRHPLRQRLIYLHNLHFHRLTWLLARILL